MNSKTSKSKKRTVFHGNLNELNFKERQSLTAKMISGYVNDPPEVYIRPPSIMKAIEPGTKVVKI
jgi:hypothetical protein|tara:strand:- start:445 stop:639 length:195 start_codon:yes stop_codon:yes gene_type:complete